MLRRGALVGAVRKPSSNYRSVIRLASVAAGKVEHISPWRLLSAGFAVITEVYELSLFSAKFPKRCRRSGAAELYEQTGIDSRRMFFLNSYGRS
jgi:hypothetical protein